MNEAETRADLIDPVLTAAGWGVVEGSHIRREMQITQGRLTGVGSRTAKDIADYVLEYKGQNLAVVEAKRRSLPASEGLGQAKGYAQKLQTRFAYSTNGDGIYQVDMKTAEEGDVERYPTPNEMWDAIYSESKARERYWRDRFAAIPFEDKGGQWQPRYYQHNAITKTLESLASGKDRILLTLATGTGKTAIAFQLAWKLFESKWNLGDWKTIEEGKEPKRRPRILFLADRNILADQAYLSFTAFQDDALVRIDPSSIRKKGRVPKNGSVFFTIFQTFMSGRDENGDPKPSFGDYPKDFFDFIIIDECHRGGASDESNWRGIMEYFSPAVQLGLTATPKRKGNTDTYAYFGEPVYIYSLKEGINDGFLTPFKVKQIQTTLDEYVYTSDDDVIEGDIEEGKRYTEGDFNKIIEIKDREEKRVRIFMDTANQKEKAIVFCATQVHAAIVRDLINQMKDSSDPNYCVRVTANDGERGEQFLRTFQDNEKTIPTILTTSQKLSTGVDARNIRNIVLMRPVNSMIEFKQIIGRGTRLYEGKEFFTIYDFVKAHEHFSDPEWDGEPVEPVPTIPKPEPQGDPDPETPPEPKEPTERPQKIKVKLSDGKTRAIDHMMATSFWSPDGKPLSAEEFLVSLYGKLPVLFKDEAELRRIWGKPSTRKTLLNDLEESGFSMQDLSKFAQLINAENSDIFDVLAYIAYEHSPITRKERVEHSRSLIFGDYDPKQQEFLNFVLNQYIDQGVSELDQEKLPTLVELKYHSVDDAVQQLGTVEGISRIFSEFQEHLYTNGESAEPLVAQGG